MKRIILFLFICITCSIQSTANDNWMHWRGPLMNGSNPEATPPIKWSVDSNVLWKVNIPGQGSSTPIVYDGKIYVTSAVKTDKKKEGAVDTLPPQDNGRRRFRGVPPVNYYQFNVHCLDLETGKEIWKQTAAEALPHEGHHATGSFAAGSPVTDGEHLYVTFGSQGIFCYDLNGNKQWDKDFGDMYTRNSFGEGTSLTVEGDALIMSWDHERDSYLYILNKKNGDELWKKARIERTSWSTPVVFEYDGIKQVIVHGAEKVISYNLATGDIIWECGGQTVNPIPTPIRFNDTVFITSGYRGSALFAIPLHATGDITGSDKIKWSYNKNTPYVPSPVLVEDYLYFVKSNDPILTCVNVRDGSVVYGPERLNVKGNVYSSLGYANGFIFINTREGETTVLKHGETLEEVQNNSLNETIDASPVFVGNKLIIRGEKTLYCFAE